MRSQENFGKYLQNIQTSLWCVMCAALLGYLIIIQITNAIRPLKGHPSYKKKFWLYFSIITVSNIFLILLLLEGFQELQLAFQDDKDGNPSNLTYEIVFLACSYAIIPFVELLIFQDRQVKARYLLLPILLMILLSLVSTIFNLMIYGFGQTFFVFFRHLSYFALPAILSQTNIYTFTDE